MDNNEVEPWQHASKQGAYKGSDQQECGMYRRIDPFRVVDEHSFGIVMLRQRCSGSLAFAWSVLAEFGLPDNSICRFTSAIGSLRH
jgi:hypothetical protein